MSLWLRLGVGAAVVLLFVAMAWRLDTVTTQRNVAEKNAIAEAARADATAEAAKALAAAAVSNKRIEQEVAGLKREIRASAATVQREIASAPPEDDAPLSPVMLRALDGLRRLHADAETKARAAPREDGDPGGAK